MAQMFDEQTPKQALARIKRATAARSTSSPYRLAPAHPYPAAIEDVRSTILFLQEHAGRFQIRPDRLILLGESAGRHLVSLIRARYGRDLGLWGVISFYGRQDLM